MATDFLPAKLKEFGSLRDQLKAKVSLDDNKKNLFEHLTKVMDHIVYHCPQDALNKLEEISYLLKEGNTSKLEHFLLTNKVETYCKPSDSGTKEATKSYVYRSKQMFKVNMVADDDGNMAPEVPAPVGNIPDLLADSKTW